MAWLSKLQPLIERSLLMLLLTFAVAEYGSATTLKTRRIRVGEVHLTVEIADSSESREKGLMNRTHLPADRGMLFIFEGESVRSFWMKDTFIPLDIGFFDAKKRLVDVQSMDPVTSVAQRQVPQYFSRHPAKYALEVNRGWFKKNKVRPPAKFSFLP